MDDPGMSKAGGRNIDVVVLGDDGDDPIFHHISSASLNDFNAFF
jgi:hypothetical protein